MNNLKNQISNLQRKLSRMDINGATTNRATANNNNNTSRTGAGSRRRRRRRNRANNRNPSAAGSTAAAVAAASDPRRGVRYLGVDAAGTIRIRRKELVQAVKGAASGSVGVHPDSMPWFKKLASPFDQIIWHSCVFEYRPCASATVSGSFSMGIDWDSNSPTVVSYNSVANLTPVRDGPMWRALTMPLPANRLQSRRMYMLHVANDNKADFDYDRMPGYLNYCSTASDPNTVYGHIWCTYDVTLLGTAS